MMSPGLAGAGPTPGTKMEATAAAPSPPPTAPGPGPGPHFGGPLPSGPPPASPDQQGQPQAKGGARHLSARGARLRARDVTRGPCKACAAVPGVPPNPTPIPRGASAHR